MILSAQVVVLRRMNTFDTLMTRTKFALILLRY